MCEIPPSAHSSHHMSEKLAEPVCTATSLSGSANLSKHEATKKEMEDLITKETLKSGVHMVGPRYQFAAVTDLKQFEDETARGKLKNRGWMACDFVVDKNPGNEYERTFKTGQPIVLTEKDNLLVYPIFFPAWPGCECSSEGHSLQSHAPQGLHIARQERQARRKVCCGAA